LSPEGIDGASRPGYSGLKFDEEGDNQRSGLWFWSLEVGGGDCRGEIKQQQKRGGTAKKQKKTGKGQIRKRETFPFRPRAGKSRQKKMRSGGGKRGKLGKRPAWGKTSR